MTLAVEYGPQGEAIVKCPIRRRLFQLTPEERVRQALIWFLRERSSRATAIARQVRFGVEDCSLDIAAFSDGAAIDERFEPRLTVAIIETKKQDEELTSHIDQLRKYMSRERCRSGLLFNGRQAIWVSLGNTFMNPEWCIEPLPDLLDVEHGLEKAAAEGSLHLAGCRRFFNAAASGDFESMRPLVEAFGMDMGLTFALSIRTRATIGSVQAFSIKAESPDAFSYRVRGVYSKSRQSISRADFHSLLTVKRI